MNKWFISLLLALAACAPTVHENGPAGEGASKGRPAASPRRLLNLKFPDPRLMAGVVTLPKELDEDSYRIVLDAYRLYAIAPSLFTEDRVRELKGYRTRVEGWAFRSIASLLDMGETAKAYEQWHLFVTTVGSPTSPYARKVERRLEAALKSQGRAVEYAEYLWLHRDTFDARTRQAEYDKILFWVVLGRMVREERARLFLRIVISREDKVYSSLVEMAGRVPDPVLVPVLQKWLGVMYSLPVSRDSSKPVMSPVSLEDVAGYIVALMVMEPTYVKVVAGDIDGAIRYLRELKESGRATQLFEKAASSKIMRSGEDRDAQELVSRIRRKIDDVIALLAQTEDRALLLSRAAAMFGDSLGKPAKRIILAKVGDETVGFLSYLEDRLDSLDHFGPSYTERYLILRFLNASSRDVDPEAVSLFFKYQRKAVAFFMGMEDSDAVNAELTLASKAIGWRKAKWPSKDFDFTITDICLTKYHLAVLRGDVERARRILESCPGSDDEDVLREKARLEFWTGHCEQSLRYIKVLSEKSGYGFALALGLLPYRIDCLRKLGRDQEVKVVKGGTLMALNSILRALGGEGAGSIDEAKISMFRYILLNSLFLDLGSKMEDTLISQYQRILSNTSTQDDCTDYVSIIRALITRGRVRRAKSFFTSMISKKVCPPSRKWYVAMWIYLFGRIKGIDPRELVMSLQVLNSPAPTRWLGHLTRLVLGKEKLDAALAAARLPGQKCEAHFYHALSLMVAGRYEAAHGELEKVIDLKIFNYHEHELAYWLLRRWSDFVPARTNSTRR